MTKSIEAQIKQVRVYKDGEYIASFGFEAIYRSYNYGFTHEVNMYYTLFSINKSGHNTYKATYYNRTWECYRYQSCISGCLSNLLEEVKKEITDRIKEQNEWKKLTEDRRNIVEEAIRQDEVLKMLETVKKELTGNSDKLIEIHL